MSDSNGFTDDQIVRYVADGLRTGFGTCPDCISTNTVVLGIGSFGVRAWRDLTCIDCDLEWREHFNFKEIERL